MFTNSTVHKKTYLFFTISIRFLKTFYISSATLSIMVAFYCVFKIEILVKRVPQIVHLRDFLNFVFLLYIVVQTLWTLKQRCVQGYKQYTYVRALRIIRYTWNSIESSHHVHSVIEILSKEKRDE